MLKAPPYISNNFLIKQLPAAIAFINKKFEVVYASDRWIVDHELEPSAVFGKRIDTLLTKLNDKWEDTLRDYLSGKADEAQVDYNLDTDSGGKWYEWTCNPWYDENGNIIGLIIYTNDITKQKLAEEKLRKLRSILEVTSEIGKIGSWEYCITENKLEWCGMVRKMHEVADNYVPTVEDAILFYKDGYSRNTIAMVVHNALEKGTPWSERLQIVTSEGNEIWVQSSGMPLFKNEKMVGLTGTFQNIEDQIQFEAKTNENEQLLRTLIDNLPLNVFIKDSESRKILVNKSECDYLGASSPKELLGKTDFDLYDKEMAQISRDEDVEVMETLIPILGRETINRKKNGEVTTFLTSKIPLKSADGRANKLIGISIDISHIKQKEKELRNLINVASLQNKKLINFAHIVSHNLRSHTANFAMLLDFLIKEKNESAKKNIIKMLTDASDNLLDTLENLNEVVAINTNVNLKRIPINLNSKISAAEENLKAFLLNSNATIVNTISDTVQVKVVSSYIDSILMNFITNAVKYKDPERNPIVTLSTKSENGFTILSIEDNGLGMNLEKYGDKLFGMYKTFHDNTDARGIGLYITKNQIEAMKGKVNVQSKVGKGTKFNIYFNEKD